MRTRHQLATGLAVVLSGTILAGPAVAGSGQDLRSPDAADSGTGAVQSPQAIVPAQDLRSPDGADAGATVVPGPTGAPALVNSGAPQASAASGFDWGSAAIGAAGMIGLVAVGLGATLAVHRRRAALPPIAP